METAVEWLVQEYIKKSELTREMISEAKEMEKKQIIDAYLQGADIGEMFNNENRAFNTDAEQYYIKKFKSE